MIAQEPEYVVDFSTLWVVTDWIEAHCILSSPVTGLGPFVKYDWQLWCTVNHYRIKPDAVAAGTERRDGSRVSVASAFFNRRSQIVAPQKTGKGPDAATIVCAEAAGPVTFTGWAQGGEAYDCADFGCSCGWGYEYKPGEPMGEPWDQALIQLLATSEDQTDNIYMPLQSMIRNGPLAEQMRVGEGFIRTRNDGRIDPVTSKAASKLGNPITCAIQDESGLYTATNGLIKVAETQRRGLAGMGGRSMETTNPWDPAENSTAQRTYESNAPDIFKFYRQPPATLSFKNKVERRRILAYVYRGSTHVDLDAIEAEAVELMEKDPAQAERFFGNKLVQGLGSWLPDGLWASRERDPGVKWADKPYPARGSQVCLGFDGSETNDWTAIRLRTLDGYRFTPRYGPDALPTIWNPVEYGGSIPRGEVNAAVDEICRYFKVKRAYCDPHDWQSEIGDWSIKYGEDVFLEWATNRRTHMYPALNRAVTDLVTGRSGHDGCPITATHVANARKLSIPGPEGAYVLGKPHGAYHQKIDAAMADVLAWEAGEDARADGWGKRKGGAGRVIALT